VPQTYPVQATQQWPLRAKSGHSLLRPLLRGYGPQHQEVRPTHFVTFAMSALRQLRTCVATPVQF